MDQFLTEKKTKYFSTACVLVMKKVKNPKDDNHQWIHESDHDSIDQTSKLVKEMINIEKNYQERVIETDRS